MTDPVIIAAIWALMTVFSVSALVIGVLWYKSLSEDGTFALRRTKHKIQAEKLEHMAVEHKR